MQIVRQLLVSLLVNQLMRWSQYFIPTLREDPADAEVVSHKLLLRAGVIRQLSAGIYSLLPLGQRIALKVMQILREEMNAIGGRSSICRHSTQPKFGRNQDAGLRLATRCFD